MFECLQVGLPDLPVFFWEEAGEEGREEVIGEGKSHFLDHP